jgi:hypothetical protein
MCKGKLMSSVKAVGRIKRFGFLVDLVQTTEKSWVAVTAAVPWCRLATK